MSAIVFIPLTQGKCAIIDFEDFEKIRGMKWCAAKQGRRWYAVRKRNRKMVFLHRFLLDAPYGLQVDHIDGDGLNNTRVNLRLCSNVQNHRGHKRKCKTATSKYRGVSWEKGRSCWHAVITVNHKGFHLGRFDNEEAAARAYDKAAKKYFGEFASPNFI